MILIKLPTITLTKPGRPSGFTLIEILIVVAILGVLMAAAIPTFNSYNRGQFLAQAVKTIKSDLRTAQNFSISGAQGKVWGIRFTLNSSSYSFFTCDPSTTPLTDYINCPATKTQNLNSSLRVAGISVGTSTYPSADLAFDAVTGKYYVSGVAPTAVTDIVIDFVSGASNPKHVCVSVLGGVREELTLPSCQ